MGFSLHLVIHIAQWVVIRKYIPAIATTFMALVYSMYTLWYIISTQTFTLADLTLWSVVGFILAAGNLALAHKLAALFDKRAGKSNTP